MKIKLPPCWIGTVSPRWVAGLLVLLNGHLVLAADENYVNYGIVTEAPQVDAVNFINFGTFNIFTSDPFQTSDTLNYTNYGTMIGATGWRFDNGPTDFGSRGMASTFFNGPQASVQADDVNGLVIVGIPNQAPVLPSYLWVRATNIVNQGLLSVGANGWMSLTGTNINLARSGLEVQDISKSGGLGSINGDTNFLPDVGISDLWWGQTNLTFDTSGIWDGQSASAPFHPVRGRFGGVSFSMPGPLADSLTTSFGLLVSVTNIVGVTNVGPVVPVLYPSNVLVTTVYVPTNIYKQGVFVGISDPARMVGAISFYRSTSLTNPFQTACVQIAFLSTNVITAALEPSTLYFYDTLASETNRGLNLNVSSGLTFRPANYLLSRVDDGRFAAGITGDGVPDPNFFFDPTTFSNAVVTGDYAGYGAFVDDLVSEPAPVAGGTVTNLPGRLQVYADSLDLRSTRIRGGGQVDLNTKHLISSEGAAVDCQNLSFNLASTNGNLKVADLAKDSVERLRGDIVAWSGLWSNSMTLVYMGNYEISTNFDTNGNLVSLSATNAPLTNGAAINLHALLLDGDQLATQIPVTTWDMFARSTNTVINDNLTVVEAFLVDGQSFTLNGNVAFSSATLQTAIGTSVSSSISDWIYTNAPNLLYFTNNGALTLPQNGHFGDDRAVPYSTFVNNGRISAASISFNGNYFQDSGALSARGALNMAGGSGKLEGGTSSAGGEVNVTCNDLKLNNYQFTAAGRLQLKVRNSLLDAGGSSANQLTLKSGLAMPSKPPLGDLLGTTLNLQPPNFVEVDHTWPGLDRGPIALGYSNNVAIGSLVLAPSATDPLRAPLIRFIGAGAQNGLYVDMLDISAMGTNWNLIQQQMLEVDPNIVIYYAAAKLGFTPPANSASVPVEPEEFLDGQLGGHLRWVNSYAGPNSSVDVISNGVTIVVNKALRFSKIIDSNGDGVPNFFDANPFNVVPPVLSAQVVPVGEPASRSVAVSWNALPKTLYHVEYSTSLQGGNWQPLTDYTSSSQVAQRVTIWDTNAPVNVQRFYRIRYTP